MKPMSPVLLYLGLYHVIAILFVLFISGFISPLTICWLVLVVISDLYYSHIGVAYSLAMLFGIAFVSVAMSELSLAILVTTLFYAGAIAITGLFLNRLRSVQMVEHEDFLETRQQQTVQQTQLNSLVNSINEAIISTNAKGIVQVYNAATLNLLDTNQSLAGKPLNDILQTYDHAGEPVDLFASLSTLSKTYQRDDLEHRFTDGESIKLGISSSAIRNNQPDAKNRIEGYILVVRDITKSKSLEEERDEFISVVSHELRTPITIAEGTISNLQLFLERGADVKTVAPSLKTAHDQILYLAKMVNDLSTLSRAERGVADSPEVIDVTELVHGLYTEYEKKAETKGLTLNLDTAGKLGTVTVSRLYLEEVIQNFITNAIKYTAEGSVTLSAHRTGDVITFAVKDTGIGISKGDQKKVFEKFYRSEDYRTRETSGTGLGLYVVQKLSHKLGIHVKLTSRLNHGSTFSFTLKAS
ncbi:PAS domain S-box protein [Pedobacter sp.]|nr:PAS domain S-box protein [Candidatus Saccharibacteria bacterium]